MTRSPASGTRTCSGSGDRILTRARTPVAHTWRRHHGTPPRGGSVIRRSSCAGRDSLASSGPPRPPPTILPARRSITSQRLAITGEHETALKASGSPVRDSWSCAFTTSAHDLLDRRREERTTMVRPTLVATEACSSASSCAPTPLRLPLLSSNSLTVLHSECRRHPCDVENWMVQKGHESAT
jgi:hypothetical protein